MNKIRFLEFGWLKSILLVIIAFALHFISETFMPIGGTPSFFQRTIMGISKVLYILLVVYVAITIVYTLALKFKK